MQGQSEAQQRPLLTSVVMMMFREMYLKIGDLD